MTINAGIWIDHKQAIVVLLTDSNQEIKKITFDIGQATWPTESMARPKNKYRPNDFVAENKLERKTESDRKDYYNDVIAAVKEVGRLLILGPGEAKGEFCKFVKQKKIRGLGLEVETSDKMTDRQLVAKVKQHFSIQPAMSAPAAASKTTGIKSTKKSVAPKKAAPMGAKKVVTAKKAAKKSKP